MNINIKLRKMLVIGRRRPPGGRYLQEVVDEPTPLATETDVKQFEQLIGYDLPMDYRHFLLTINGGFFQNTVVDYPLFSVVPFLDASHVRSQSAELSTKGGITSLYSLFNGYEAILGDELDFHQLEVNAKRFKELYDDLNYELVPPCCIPIAEYGGGSIELLLVLDGIHKNKVLVYYYNEEKPHYELYANVSLAANSFSEFLKKLTFAPLK